MMPMTVKSDKKSSSSALKQSLSGSSNVINYRLSNEQYVKLGWTIKPRTKLVRRIVLYATEIAKPHMTWSRSIIGNKFYSDNETPFIICNDQSSRRIFYPGGHVAIKARKPSAKLNYDLYMVLTPGGQDKLDVDQESYMIAAFDTLGNGLVLDEDGGMRLTYNQIGGICFDKRVALVPFAWTWSRRKAEPIMEAIHIEAAAARLAKILQDNSKATKSALSSKKTPKLTKSVDKKILMDNQELTVDSGSNNDNSLASIRTICLKLNKFISLRILDRRNINLQFFAGTRNVRIELGFDVNFKKPLKSFLEDPSWGPKDLLQCRFDEESSKLFQFKKFRKKWEKNNSHRIFYK